MRLFASERIAKVMDKLGFKEGDMIEAPIINNSIERAQKKVEENNFGIRKRLLEYDDVMNKQRTLIYEKRRHALMGERIGMDISNMIWDRVVTIISNNDYQGCVEQFLEVMAMEVPFTEAQFSDKRREDLFETSFQAAMTHFKRKMERLVETAYPVIKRVYEEQGEIYENILVPITDGKHVFNIRTNLKEAYDTQAQAVVREFEKNILLHNIDDAWKENLRELDELKKSVQNASYEQKDPLLIFKLESAKIFETMVNKINNSTISTLLRGQIYAPEQTTQVREAAPVQAPKQQYTESKENLDEDRSEMAKAAARDTREQVTQPIIKSKQPGRNDPCPCGSGKKFKNCHGRGLV
jgi:preprotein translocase subunit SecA